MSQFVDSEVQMFILKMHQNQTLVLCPKTWCSSKFGWNPFFSNVWDIPLIKETNRAKNITSLASVISLKRMNEVINPGPLCVSIWEHGPNWKLKVHINKVQIHFPQRWVLTLQYFLSRWCVQVFFDKFGCSVSNVMIDNWALLSGASVWFVRTQFLPLTPPPEISWQLTTIQL